MESDNNQGAGRIEGYKAFMEEVEPPTPPDPPKKKRFKVDLRLEIPNMIKLPITGTIEEEEDDTT